MQMVGSGMCGSCCASDVDNERMLKIDDAKGDGMFEERRGELRVVLRLG